MQSRQTSIAPSNSTSSTVPPTTTIRPDERFDASTIAGFNADRTTNDAEDDRDEGPD
ncbi:hypothetical protein JCGZ_08864 [Jatropha curcas]|uniref:Uncharacterized protein n=1 Tax=Jatropha curcas TaxID=180498 RepID=A0A067KK66_JATCU|nr:hypothetical protein JCGZ_08864 [Jatropha curcas]